MAMKVSTSGEGRRSTPAIKVAVAAVALSVGVMLAAIAIVTGFKEEITRKVIGFNPHIVLKPSQAFSQDDYMVTLSPALQESLDSVSYITSYALAASAPAIFKTPTDFKGVYLRSSGNDYGKIFLTNQIEEGEYPDLAEEKDAVVISRIAADQLKLNVGDTLHTYFITENVIVRPMRIAAIYNSHFSTYDDIFAFTSLPLVQEIGKIEPHEGTSLNIYVNDFSRIDEYALDLRRQLDSKFAAGMLNQYFDMDTSLTSGANFFSWLALLDTNVVVILALMISVALVTLISGMMILMVDKVRLIEILRALGAPGIMIRKIFVWLTLRVAFYGLLIGNAVTLCILCLQERYHFLPLDADNYYIDFVPVEIKPGSILILNVCVLIITFVVLRLFSYRTVKARNLLVN